MVLIVIPLLARIQRNVQGGCLNGRKRVAVTGRPEPERIAFLRDLASDNRAEAQGTLDNWEELSMLGQARLYALLGEGDEGIGAAQPQRFLD